MKWHTKYRIFYVGADLHAQLMCLDEMGMIWLEGLIYWLKSFKSGEIYTILWQFQKSAQSRTLYTILDVIILKL